MWTLGRDREKEHARKFLGSKDSKVLEQVIDAVHDLIEQKKVTKATTDALHAGLLEGASGTWESAGSWLIKACREFSELCTLWVELSSHPSSKIRFRVAAFVEDMPDGIARKVLPQLLADPSVKVRSKVASDQHNTKRGWIIELLEQRLKIEESAEVRDNIGFALDSFRGR